MTAEPYSRSSPRKRGSSDYQPFWTPACAGVTRGRQGALFFLRRNSSGLRRRRGLLDRFHAEAHPALLVGLEHLDFYLLALFEIVGYVVDALVGDLRNVQKPVFPRQQLDDCAKVEKLEYGAVVHATHLDIGCNVFDALLRGLPALGRNTGDRDRAVVGDFDRGSGLLLQPADHHSSLADHVADLLRIDLDLDDAGGIARNLRARSLQYLLHDTEDVHAAFARLGERHLHDLLGNTLDLDVHLQRSHAALGSRHLEVHVAEM